MALSSALLLFLTIIALVFSGVAYLNKRYPGIDHATQANLALICQRIVGGCVFLGVFVAAAFIVCVVYGV